jgi:hypothetical protein
MNVAWIVSFTDVASAPSGTVSVMMPAEIVPPEGPTTHPSELVHGTAPPAPAVAPPAPMLEDAAHRIDLATGDVRSPRQGQLRAVGGGEDDVERAHEAGLARRLERDRARHDG